MMPSSRLEPQRWVTRLSHYLSYFTLFARPRNLRLVKFNSLLMCREQASLRLLGIAFDKLGIAQETCLSSAAALELMNPGRYSALVLDFDLPGASQVARMARLARPKRRPVIFAMIGAQTGIASAFQAGANFVLYKPLVLEQVIRSARAARVFMQPDRRRSQRQKLESLVYLQFGVAAIPALVLDLSERGLSLQAPEPLPSVEEVTWRFVLPGTSHMVQGDGELIWADDEGRAGLLFSKINPASRRHLRQWLSKHIPKKRTSGRVVRVDDLKAFAHAAH